MDELSEAELRYYNDLFKICSESSDSSGKIPALKATSLFRSANLSNEVINKITSLVGIPQTALHLSRQQFYGCLKLIAAYQASVPLREEILTSTVSLPLPQFSWIDSPTASASSSTSTGGAVNANSSAMPDRNGFGGRSADYIEMKNNQDLIELTARNNFNSRDRVETTSNSGDITNSDQPSTDSEVDHNDDSMLRSAERHHVVTVKGHGVGKLVGGGTGPHSSTVGGSPEAWSTASDSPTPTNSVAERPWANQNLWQGLVCEEQRQLLGTEEESSDKHSSDEDQEIDLEYFYQISQTQKEYYLKQFRTIQPDVHGLVSGQVARVFFEKSRIPVEELRHIWQMCDITRDGALNLAEFTAAMHLVVLRRNNIPVPATLPPCLMPNLLQHSLFASAGGTLQNQHSGGSTGTASTGHQPLVADNGTRERTGPEEADLLHLESDDNTDSNNKVPNVDTKDYQRMIVHPEQHKYGQQLSTNSTASVTLVAVSGTESPPTISSTTGSSKLVSTTSGRKTPTNMTSPLQQKSKVSNEQHTTPPNTISNKEWNTSGKEWTKFAESPTSNVSSPGPKPVNFDMQRTTQAIVSDPQILHPVPLRVTPVGAEAADNSNLVYSDVTVGSGGILIVQRDDSSPKQHQAQNQSQHQAHSSQRDSLTSGDLRAIQRPQPKKPPSKGVGAIPPPPQRESSVTSNSGINVVDAMATSLDTATFNSVINSTAGFASINTTTNSASKKDQMPPPLPPPRPTQHRHTRSSSLDLNKLKLSTAGGAAAGVTKHLEDQMRMPPPPEVPPRVTPTAEQHPSTLGFADFAQFPNATGAAGTRMASVENNVTTILLDASGNMTTTHHPSPRGSVSNALIAAGPHLQSVSRNSAFEVYRKPQQSRGSQSPPQPPPLVASRSVESSSFEYEKRISALSDNLRQVRFKGSEGGSAPDVLKHLKEQNQLLLRICGDLSDELLQIQQKREDIRIKIELQEQNLGATAATVAGVQTVSALGPPSHLA